MIQAKHVELQNWKDMEIYEEIEDQRQKSYFDKMGDNGKDL